MGAYLLTERFAIPNRFRIATIEVKGNQFLSEGEVREMLGPAMGGNLISADLEGLRVESRRISLGRAARSSAASFPTPFSST